MEFDALRESLAGDYARLRQVATDLDAQVPSCPDWTVDQLVRHVSFVYLHKVACMTQGRPQSWPPDLSAEPTLDLLDRAYRELIVEFDSRPPESPSYTWFDPDQTVGFWVRRMAHETAIHRFDAELAAGTPTPVSTELAIDGVDEVLSVILGWDDEVRPADLAAIEVRTGERSWVVRATTSGVEINKTVDASTAITGDPSPVLLWLWRRSDAAGLKVTGDPAGVDVLNDLMEGATQ